MISKEKAATCYILLFLTASLVLVGAVGMYRWHYIGYGATWTILGILILLVISTTVLIETFRIRLVVIKLPKRKAHTYINRMHNEATEKKDPEKKEIEVLNADQARVWLDDFLVKQQSEAGKKFDEDGSGAAGR